MMKPRSCWTVLLQRCTEQVSLIQVELVKSRAHLLGLQASAERLHQLYGAYQTAPPSDQVLRGGMQETMNQRQFASQLLTLMQRVDADMAQTVVIVQDTRKRLAHAERERLKMQALVDQDLLAVQTHTRRAEQKSMDGLGVMLFNLDPIR